MVVEDLKMLSKTRIKEMEESTGHSVFGPSSLPRIVLCPGSVSECLKVPPSETSEFAAHGSMLHDKVEKILKELSTVPQLYEDENLSVPDISYVLDCLEWVDKLMLAHREQNVKHIVYGIEKQVTLASFGLPEVFGTADYLLSSEYRVDVTDWKFGQGVPRYAKGCMQSLAYAAGAITYDPDIPGDFPVHIHIVQPPLNIFDPWKLTYADVVRIVDEVLHPAIAEAKSENPRFNPGLSQCRFCDAHMVCEARHNSTKKNAAKVFNAMSDLTIVSDEAIAKLLTKATEIQQYIKDAQKYAATRIRKGYGFPGFKMVASRGSRKWIDEEVAEKWLKKKGFADEQLKPGKFLTAPAAEKLKQTFKKDPEFKKLYVKVDGAPKLAEESDKGRAISYNQADEFAEFAAKDS